MPLPNKKYGNDMANLGPYMAHMWKSYGKVGDHMELIWGQIFANFKLWKVYGKKSSCYVLYGRAMGTECP